MHLGRCISSGKRPRMRRRRLPTSSTDPRRPRGDLRTTNRLDSTGAAVMVGPSISRIKKINFFGPQFLSHCSLWTTNEPDATRTTACRCMLAFASALHAASSASGRTSFSQYICITRRTLLQECHSTPAIDAAAAVGVSAYPKPVCCLSDHKQRAGSLGAHRSKLSS